MLVQKCTVGNSCSSKEELKGEGSTSQSSDLSGTATVKNKKSFSSRAKSVGIGLGYTGLVFFALAKSTFLWDLFNKGTQQVGFVPHPQTQNKVVDDIPAKSFRDTEILNKILWGHDPDYKNLYQGGRPNCQVMGAIQSKVLTQVGLDELKTRVQVTDYDLSPENFFIDTVVHLGNGKSINVSYDELIKWMSPRGITPSLSTDGSLAIPILTLALEKELTDKYDGVPPTIPSSAPILLTGKSYSTVAISPFVVSSLSDSELIKIFKKAPDVPIFVSSFGRISDFTNWLTAQRKEKFEFLPVSEEKSLAFKESASKRVKEISENVTPKAFPGVELPPPPIDPSLVIASIGPRAISPTDITSSSETSYFPENHFYVVKGFDPDTNTVLITDSHGVKYKPLTLSELKQKMFVVTMPAEDVPVFSQETLLAYLLLLLTIGGHVAYKKSRSVKVEALVG